MKKKINCTLLIDDDITSNFINERSIRNSDITNEIKIAPNGEVARTYIEEDNMGNLPNPELIFLDIKMPVMDGFEFLSWFKNNKERMDSTVIALTNSVRAQDMDKLYELGVTDYISKPLTEEKITKMMQKHFGW